MAQTGKSQQAGLDRVQLGMELVGAQPSVPQVVPGTCGIVGALSPAPTVAAVHDCLIPNMFSH